jgi:hypothetical protein
MEVLSHLFTALGRLLLWVSSLLVLEELTLGGLARLLLSKPFDSHSRQGATTATAAAPGSTERPLGIGSR